MLLTSNRSHFSWSYWLPKFLLLPYTSDGIKDAALTASTKTKGLMSCKIPQLPQLHIPDYNGMSNLYFTICATHLDIRYDHIYYLPKKSENFGWNVNGKINFVSPNGHFLGKTGFLERQTKIPKRNFRRENVRSICQFLLVPGLLAWIALIIIIIIK